MYRVEKSNLNFYNTAYGQISNFGPCTIQSQNYCTFSYLCAKVKIVVRSMGVELVHIGGVFYQKLCQNKKVRVCYTTLCKKSIMRKIIYQTLNWGWWRIYKRETKDACANLIINLLYGASINHVDSFWNILTPSLLQTVSINIRGYVVVVDNMDVW